MRLPLILWWSVVFAWLLTQRVKAQPGPGPAPLDWPTSAKGYGRNLEEARHDALKDAARKIAAVAHRHQPGLKDWIPPTRFFNYIEKQVLDGPPTPGEEVELVDQLKAKYWVFPLKSPSWEDLTALARGEQRNHRADSRLSWAWQVFLGLVTGLMIWASYLRLDLWTDYRFSPWLRAAAMLLAALVIPGLWWLLGLLSF